MTAPSRPQVIELRSGDVVQVRQVRPADAPALARAYANLGEQSRYRRFFTVMPELSEATLKAATEVDHEKHEALVAVPLLSTEIVGECRFVRRADQPDTADLGVTVVDAWQGRRARLGAACPAERARPGRRDPLFCRRGPRREPDYAGAFARRGPGRG